MRRSSGVDFDRSEVIAELGIALRELNRRFTDSSDGVLDLYGQDPRLRKAYSVYYLLANLPKVVHVLLAHAVDPLRLRSMLDLGTGPGTIPLGVLTFLSLSGAVAPAMDCVCVDRSRGFADLAGCLIRSWRESLDIRGRTRQLAVDLMDYRHPVSAPVDLLGMGNMLTEISAGGALRKVIRLAESVVVEGGLFLMIEPATPGAARKVLAVRDELVSRNWRVEGPCPGSYACPAMKRDGDWCHHRLSWSRPVLIGDLDRRAGFDKQFLNFTYCLLRRSPAGELSGADAASPGRGYIVVSDLLASKGKYEVYLCGRERKVLVKLEKKHVSASNRDLLRVQRYDRVGFEADIGRDARIELTPTSSFFRISHTMEGQ